MSIPVVEALIAIIEQHHDLGCMKHSRFMADPSCDCWVSLALGQRVEDPDNCHACWKCVPNYAFMRLCVLCGNKRCPHANDHNNVCTQSNDSGQEGSAYV